MEMIVVKVELCKCYTIEQLYNDGCAEIPNEKGIYLVIVPESFNVEFLNQTTDINEFDGKGLLYPICDLK